MNPFITSSTFIYFRFHYTRADSPMLNMFFVSSSQTRAALSSVAQHSTGGRGVLLTTVCYISTISANATRVSESFLNINTAVTTHLP